MKHCHIKSVAREFVFRFGQNKACHYCPSLSAEAFCSHRSLEHLAQIRAALKLVREDIKGSRSWLGDEVRLPRRDLVEVRAAPAHRCLTDAKKRHV